MNEWIPLRLEPAGPTARELDLTFIGLVVATGLIALTVALAVAWFTWRYRAGSSAYRHASARATSRLEWWVFAILVAGALSMFASQAWLYARQFEPPPDALVIECVGKQWMWKFLHRTGRREIDELHVPTGRAVHVVLRSQDVIHSLYLPALRVKMDALPHRWTSLWFVADRPGVYPLYCAEYCGTAHARMRGRLVVLPPEEYARWLAAEPPPDQAPVPGSPGAPDAPLYTAAAGAFTRLGCNACHVPDSALRAPRLDGIWLRPVRLQSGQEVLADEAYLRRSILHPNQDLVAGYPSPSLMPSYAGLIDEQELQELVGFIRDLRDGWPSAEAGR